MRLFFHCLFFCILILSGNKILAQKDITTNSLDSYFGGVPLDQGFQKWFDYITSHPFMGIDSVGERGGYSSFKKGKSSHFPFPDSIMVKILFQKIVYKDSSKTEAEDSTHNIAIEGVFGNGKIAKRQAIAYYKKLRKELRKYYRWERPGSTKFNSFFVNPKSKSFLPCQLFQGYSEELDFYFVMIVYDTMWEKE